MPPSHTSTSATTTIDLEDLVQGTPSAVEQCVDAMRKRGWILVRLSPHLRSTAAQAGRELAAFFQQELETMRHQSQTTKKQQPGRNLLASSRRHELDTGHPFLGYDTQDPSRQSLRILTGSELKSQKLPSTCQANTKHLAETVDETLLQITQHVYQPLFGCTFDEFSQAAREELPFLKDPQSNEPRFALLEAAYYHNSGEKLEVCAAHGDPGWLSLNVFSNQEGLQFRDEHAVWRNVGVDADIGVLWTGVMATELFPQKVVAGIHRVLLPSGSGPKGPAKPRLSIWTEICTKDQVFLLDSMGWGKEPGKVQGNKIHVPNIVGDEPYVVSIQKGSLLETLRLVQRLEGLPMSKIMRVPLYNKDGEVIGIK